MSARDQEVVFTASAQSAAVGRIETEDAWIHLTALGSIAVTSSGVKSRTSFWPMTIVSHVIDLSGLRRAGCRPSPDVLSLISSAESAARCLETARHLGRQPIDARRCRNGSPQAAGLRRQRRGRGSIAIVAPRHRITSGSDRASSVESRISWAAWFPQRRAPPRPARHVGVLRRGRCRYRRRYGASACPRAVHEDDVRQIGVHRPPRRRVTRARQPWLLDDPTERSGEASKSCADPSSTESGVAGRRKPIVQCQSRQPIPRTTVQAVPRC